MYALWLIASAVLGAGLMYFIDPRRGSMRRNRMKNTVTDTAKSLASKASTTASGVIEDVKVRMYVAADDTVEEVTTRAYVLGDDALDAAADTLEDAQIRGYVAADDAVDSAKKAAKKTAENVKNRAADAAAKAKGKAGEMASQAKNRVRDKASELADDMRTKAVAAFEKVHTTVEDMTPADLNALLLHEVRRAVEGVSQNPNAIKIVIEDDGRVILRGPVLPDEVDRLIEAVDAVPGVVMVENDLDAHGMVGDDRTLYNPPTE